MIYSKEMYLLGNKKSSIREMFEYGKKRAAIVGSQNVFDFSLGNPTVSPPTCVNEEICKLVRKSDPVSLHGYTSAQGDFETRKAIADYINGRYNTHFAADNFYITVGAAAALSMAFKALITSNTDEIIAIAPFFPEYKVFVNAAGATLKVVPPDTVNFQIDFNALESMISVNTKAVIINSPNNPSGAVYNKSTIQRLADLLERKQKEFGNPIFIVSDEPYREIVYDDIEVPYVTNYYRNTLVCYSYSKSLSLPGERIGFILVPNEAYESKQLYAAICGAGRALGYVCAPSLFQKVIVKCIGKTGNIELYKNNRDLLYKGLTELGYQCFKPDGAFYMLVKSFEKNTENFCEKAKQVDLLLVSATDFGCPGYVRVSYCVDSDMIKRSFYAFKKLKDMY